MELYKDKDLQRFIERINVLEFIQKNQLCSVKEIRTKFPAYSEAKISLIIKKLEAEDKIQKYKKGRANIISIK